ncbi:penicillin-binding protein 1A [Sphingoaurantiacus capsulatus]|uniref:Penicillin-binding protein 1A n=1 Tax=Sphingoaurantiacus capsulatus TaxID=1771310 RepID=A0ABV7XBA3_9SPHN
MSERVSSGPVRLRRMADWRGRIEALPRWVRVSGAALLGVAGLGLIAGIALYIWLVQGLPSASELAEYEPPLPTHVRAIDGSAMHTFARERRVFVPYPEIPRPLINAFISAEDKTFFTHGGLDYPGIAQAVLTNLSNSGRPVGASTITQQVAKNLLLTSEVSYIRKGREAILAKRIEDAFTKEEIIELYLNQIFLGRNAYGIEAASQAYFNKSVDKLTIPEMAYLAVLPKAPSNYNPVRHLERATNRRNWVLRQMAENGYISDAQMREAQATPLLAVRPADVKRDRTGSYFLEDVRRELIARYGETAEDSPNSVYAGGLWVRTTINPAMQRAAEYALRDGLVKYDNVRGWRGAQDKIALGDGWRERLQALNIPVGYDDWRAAVILSNDRRVAQIGFEDGTTGSLPRSNAPQVLRGVGTPALDVLKPGDVIAVRVLDNNAGYALRQIPEVGGGMVVQDVHTGRVLAMVGGFDSRRSQFNRASQAQRQPGSTFKPFVYATALDNGYTPASIINDAPFCVFQTKLLGNKCFRNFTGGYAGPQTMRWGIEQSRNLMTVRAASNVGMDKIVANAKDWGIGTYDPVLSMALGAGETTVLKMTNAFGMLANGGKRITPILIDQIQDRRGKTIFRADARPCEGCNSADWLGEAMPRPGDVRKQAMDARTAYQMVHILEGVVQRGTATVLRDLDRPLFGKTGTTNGPTNVWFVGGTADVVAGVYIGYDQPRDMGNWAQGGRIAAPIFKDFAIAALKDAPKNEFRVPPGIRLVRIDRRSGRRVYDVFPTNLDDTKPSVIWEAFKPESEPRRLARSTGFETRATVRSDADFLQNSGGIY